MGEIMVEIGSQLRYFRQKEKMSQKQLANRLHVTPQTVSKWELDKSAPDYDQLIALSKIFRKSTDALLGQAKPSLLDYLTDPRSVVRGFGLDGLSLLEGGEERGKDQDTQ